MQIHNGYQVNQTEMKEKNCVSKNNTRHRLCTLIKQVTNVNTIVKLEIKNIQLPQDQGKVSGSYTDFVIIRTQRHSSSGHIYANMSLHQIR